MTRVAGSHSYYANPGSLYASSQKSLSDGLKSLAPALVQTSDTGQVNWATVTSTPPTNVLRDYEVYRFTDALQATKPIFIRFDYTASSTTAQLRISVGTGTDGAGNLTGTTTPSALLSNFAGSSMSTYNYYFASDGSYLTLVAGVNSEGSTIGRNTMVAAVERFRDQDGTPNGQGFHVVPLYEGDWAGYYVRYTNGNTSPSGIEYHPAVLIPTIRSGTSFVGDTVYAFPLHGYSPTLHGGSATIMWAFTNDLPRLSEIIMPVYNQPTAKWLTLGNAAAVKAAYMSTATAAVPQSMSLALRWE